jgi:hypothetical protein
MLSTPFKPATTDSIDTAQEAQEMPRTLNPGRRGAGCRRQKRVLEVVLAIPLHACR